MMIIMTIPIVIIIVTIIMTAQQLGSAQPARRPTKHVLWEQTFENRNFQNFAKMWKIARRTLGKILRKSQLSKFWKNVKNLRESLEGKKLILSKMGSGKCSYYVFPTVEGNILPPAACRLGPGGRGRLFERIFSMEALWVAGLKLRRPTKHVLWEISK